MVEVERVVVVLELYAPCLDLGEVWDKDLLLPVVALRRGVLCRSLLQR